MINQSAYIIKLQELGVEFISGVPDTLLNDFCLEVEKTWEKDKHIIAANEGNAIGQAAGYHLMTKTIPLVYMQNSGIGNCINPLVSLCHKSVYSIPMVLLIGWRGNPDVKDHPQHQKQGEMTLPLLKAMDIPYRIVKDDDTSAMQDIAWAVQEARASNHATALIATKGVFEKGEKDSFPQDDRFELTRETAINTVLETLPDDTIYVASTGRATRELYAVRDMRGEKHGNDFLNVGAMGHTSSIALGMALANKEKLVVCLEGDASAIMHLGALTSSGQTKPANFLHIVMNNGVHESVGGQRSVGHSINLTSIARSAGYKTADDFIIKKKDLVDSISWLCDSDKPGFIDLHIQKGIRNDMPALRIMHKESKKVFFEANEL